MITAYLNHAGTSWPKPSSVLGAVSRATSSPPDGWGDLFGKSHRTVAEFFHVPKSRLLLTPSCTAALELGILDHPWQSGDRVITSHLEHHAVERCLARLQNLGVVTRRISRCARDPFDLEQLEAQLKLGGVKLVALTAACNVTGESLPLEDIVGLTHAHGALALIDGAQIGGWWDLNLQQLGVDLFTFAGHKGLQAPWGIGGLYVAPEVVMASPFAACQIDPGRPQSCAPMPGYCDAGSVNLFALAGLAAACSWLAAPEQAGRLVQARRLARRLAEQLGELSGLTVHGDRAFEENMPTVAVSGAGMDLAERARRLAEQGVVCGSGFQCAPQAHVALGTAETGVLRFSFGPSSTETEVEAAVDAMRRAWH